MKPFENIWENDWRPELWSIWIPKWPEYWASGATIQHTALNVAEIDMYSNWCGTIRNFFRKWPKTEIFFTYFGVQSGPKIGPLRPIVSTHLKVLAMSIWSKTDVKPVKKFWESDQTTQFLLTLGPKMVQKLGLWGPSLKVATVSI